MTKMPTDEESEVPPPPGTEPLLPIPAIGSSPERERDPDHPHRGKMDRDRGRDRDRDEYDERLKDRRPSFGR